jgi:hypothetical protein
MTSQVSLFDKEESMTSPSFRGGSRANLTALQESVKHLLTDVICGRSSSVSFAKLTPNGLWEKTYRGCSQVKMDGSLEEYCETWPKWGLLQDGVAYLQTGLEPRIDESGCSLLPTPSGTSNGGKNHVIGRLDEWGGSSNPWRGTEIGKVRCASFEEWMMGFPMGWSDLIP